MNNLNDPPQWNIEPHPGGDRGDGNRWNYALLVPMLGLAAFRWIWSWESRKEIERAKAEFCREIKSVQEDLESKYRAIITENRRKVAQLEIELDKEQHKTLSYREALISQSRKLVEERKVLEQTHTQLQQEKKTAQLSGAAGALYQGCLAKEEEWQKKATNLLSEVEDALVERQNIYCSLMVPRKKRLEIEKKLLRRAATDPVAAEIHLKAGLTDIFQNDRHCADLTNTNSRNNGKLMWLYLKYWELAVEHKKFKKVENVMLGKSTF
ncbi:coiled-coil domain-containing protein 127 [Ambystoma mexicanum]|uniref:coiled-coil domain-containing protein 127 n=1 Tax=Ambystoma mexicanum TaxID=8296 RepID=UPI0037E723B2